MGTTFTTDCLTNILRVSWLLLGDLAVANDSLHDTNDIVALVTVRPEISDDAPPNGGQQRAV